jgi:hypothetical protein
VSNLADYVTILTSAARTASVNSQDYINTNGYQNMILTIDATAAAATPSVVFTIEGKDLASGKYYTILASAAITGTGTTILRVSPGLTAAANTIAKDFIPFVWRLKVVAADADSLTYSVGAHLS